MKLLFFFLFFLAKLCFALKIYVDTTQINLETNYFDNLVSALKKAEESNSSAEVIILSDLVINGKIMVNSSVSIR